MTYKRFHAALTSISAFFIVIFLAMAPALANEALFTIRGVEVDVTAGNALAAREQAFEQAQSMAFATLMQRLAEDEERAEFETPDPISLAAMIRDYEVTSEKLRSVYWYLYIPL